MSSEGKTQRIEVLMARQAPSWIKWGGYAVVLGLGTSYVLHPGIWIVYALVAVSIGLVYWGFECYNQFAEYYNLQQIKHLGANGELDALFEHIKGTFGDKDGLSTCEEEEDDKDK